jgi:acyl-CoA dehydrogenase-like protein
MVWPPPVGGLVILHPLGGNDGVGRILGGCIQPHRETGSASTARAHVCQGILLAEDQIGSNILADSSPLQRMWRDASIATRHGVVATDPGLEICGPR